MLVAWVALRDKFNIETARKVRTVLQDRENAC
jgi:hypothetical protein